MHNLIDCLRELIHNSVFSQHILLLIVSCFCFLCLFFSIRITRKFYRKATPFNKNKPLSTRSPLWYPCLIFIGMQFLIWNMRIDTRVGMENTAQTIFIGMITFFITGLIFDLFKLKPYIITLTFALVSTAISYIFIFKTDIVILSYLLNHAVWILWTIAICLSFILIRHYTYIYCVCGFLSMSGFFLIAICERNPLASMMFSIWAGIFLGIGLIAKYRDKKYKGLAICAVTSMSFMVSALSINISYASNGRHFFVLFTPVLLIMPFFTVSFFSLLDTIKKNKVEDKHSLSFLQASILFIMYTTNTIIAMILRLTKTPAQALILCGLSTLICIIAAHFYLYFKKPKEI